MSSESYFIGVDVGTGSARALLVKNDGTIVASSTQETITYRDPEDHRIFEQSTTNIWTCISRAIKACLSESKVPKEAVKGLGFDATCSLAVTDEAGEPVIVTKGDKLGRIGDRNIVLWADHRAEEEAELINSTGSKPLEFVGGTMSLEMEIPKVLWLKKRMDPTLFSRCQFFDLPDFLTYRATTDNTRSCCSVTCKCSYVPEGGWQPDFFEKIGLGEFVRNNYKQLGAQNDKLLTAGLPVGNGLLEKAAEELGLVEGTPVGGALIDAYAGWMGTVGARCKDNGNLSDSVLSLDESRHRLAVVAGTSTCHIVQSPNAVFVKGVWGPYKDPIFRGWWMNEGGQSSTGQLIDFVLKTHPAYPKLIEMAKDQQTSVYQVLEDVLERLRKETGAETWTEVTKDLHMYPDFHGNRSPLADSHMRGSFIGLELDDTVHDLARKYNATLESIALQNREIVVALNSRGHEIASMYVSGSQAKNLPLMRLFANTCGLPVVLPAEESTAVVLGAAMLGRYAAEVEQMRRQRQSEAEEGKEQAELLWKIMVEMTPPGTLIVPNASSRERRLLDAKYRIFQENHELQRKWRAEIEQALQD